jgi:hypothetical protein
MTKLDFLVTIAGNTQALHPESTRNIRKNVGPSQVFDGGSGSAMTYK